MTPELEIRKHPILGIRCREDGAIETLPRGCRNLDRLEWTYGADRQKPCGIYKIVQWRGKSYYVHRLIAEAFIDPDLFRITVDHIDRNPSNNNVTNLRWATPSEQQRNQSRVDQELLKYGVRCSDDPHAYSRAYGKVNRAALTKAQRERRHKKRRLS